jgi:VanZ family protein
MVSPGNYNVAARVLLVGGALVCGICMLGPFQGLERAIVPWDKAAHVIAFYGFTTLLLVAFPDRRRFDLAMLATLCGCGLELAQRLTGRDAELADMSANAIGALAVVMPIYLERLRGAPARLERRRKLARTLGRMADPPAAADRGARALRRKMF